jgi:phosphoglycerate kinase
MSVKSITDLDLKGKKVFFRFDFNVPLDDKCEIKDDTRIRRALGTIKYAVENGARCILSSHLGRPKGERKPELSLRPVGTRLSRLLGIDVAFVNDCIGDEVRSSRNSLQDGQVLLLENLRFHAGETKNDPEFSAQLAEGADAYVNDAFGTAHRAHSSTVGVPSLVKEKAAGLLMKEELDNLSRAFSNPAKPVTAIFGGAKVSDKLAVLRNIVERMECVLVGGGMANTFLKAKGCNVGASKFEEDMLNTAIEIMDAAEKAGCEFLLPLDVVAADRIESPTHIVNVPVNGIPENHMALDIYSETIQLFNERITKAGTIIWNGPMGVFEVEEFKRGTMEVAKAVAEAAGFSLVGGGDSVRAVKQAGVSDRISYISTGGGAFMEFMEGKVLPGVAALES